MINESHHPLNPIDLNIPIISTKKKREAQSNDSAKKMRITPFGWNELLDDLKIKIISLLSFRGLLTFASTAKSSEQFSDIIFNQHLIEERLNSYYSGIKSFRSRYLIAKATVCYVEECENELEHSPTNPNLQPIYERFEGMCLVYPLFGAYVKKDLTLLMKLKGVKEDFFAGAAREAANDLNDFHPCEEGGDFLLKGLYQYRLLNECIQKKRPDEDFLPEEKKLFRDAHKTLSQAIQKNASCASYLASKVFFKVSDTFESIEFLENHFYRIGIEAIGKNQDYRGLEESFLRYPRLSQRLHKIGLSYPPVLAFYAIQGHHSLNEKDLLLSEAILLYGEFVPGYVLAMAAIIKKNLKKFKEAEYLFEKAFNTIGFKPPASILIEAASIKIELNKFVEAKFFAKRALKVKGVKSPDVIAYVAFVNLKLEKYKKAEFLYEQALNSRGYKPNIKILINQAFVKLKLNKLEEAQSFYKKVFNTEGYSPNAYDLVNAASVELQLEKFDKAESFYIKAFNIPGFIPPGEELAQAAFVMLKLGKYEKAELLYEEAFKDPNFKPSPKTLNDAATVKLKLNKYEEAKAFYRQAFIHPKV